MEEKTKETEVKATTTTEGEVRTFTAEMPDGTQLVITKHADGTSTVRIGRGGKGPKVRISAKASAEASGVLA
ncbi:hypothetical protein EMO92_06940 [Bifidobacterium reuteri]|uniref:Uncharacterized protein n=1 Tax=Bifidobacterium reuteri TaxID=983706 RepID=A0A5J5E7R3_9BIFI|nr:MULTISPECIES: hypothetical protein [Bifidobacterium]KAA8825149.1 hypothetical protein EMO92_06940 [Bifidobacterium reuteri]TPF78391.1 hypothetical protein BW09_04885 [Bifidobacterium sp. UTCIF-1]TPF81189.1 hypothetical protein BW08_00695 [Bifidobacterium sp. UTCIF-24]TPF81969.1 hypothetical protein BW12_06860 [Bifidobacterium sp. UTCIF-3]TPF85183.1 hypothetical protein BW07_00490 [Bifidobacterium sp. UTCIF-36]